MKDQQPVVFRLRLIPWPDSTFSLLPAPQMEEAALPGLARGIVSNRGSSGRDRATTRCAGEHAMAPKVRLEISRGPSGNDSATTRCAGEQAMASEVRLMI